MLKGTLALAVRGQNYVHVLGSAQCARAEPSASTYITSARDCWLISHCALRLTTTVLGYRIE